MKNNCWGDQNPFSLHDVTVCFTCSTGKTNLSSPGVRNKESRFIVIPFFLSTHIHTTKLGLLARFDSNSPRIIKVMNGKYNTTNWGLSLDLSIFTSVYAIGRII